MAKPNSYQQFERQLTFALIGCAVVFVLYLIFAALGIIWLKVITAIIAILLPCLCLVFLYMTQELLKQRSLWLTTGFLGIFLCTLVSLIANFP